MKTPTRGEDDGRQQLSTVTRKRERPASMELLDDDGSLGRLTSLEELCQCSSTLGLGGHGGADLVETEKEDGAIGSRKKCRSVASMAADKELLGPAIGRRV